MYSSFYHPNKEKTTRNRFIISNYVQFLKATAEPNKYECPVCSGQNLNIAQDGKFSCLDNQCENQKISSKLKKLKKEAIKEQKQQNIENRLGKDATEILFKDVPRISKAPQLLDFLRLKFADRITWNVRTQKICLDGKEIETSSLRVFFGRYVWY